MKGTAERRAEMMARHPYCYWCGRRVHEHPRGRGRPMPDDQATIDHVNSRNQSAPRPWIGRWVLSCRKCNMARARAEERGRIKAAEEVTMTSGRRPASGHRGAPVSSVYTKFPSVARCDDCTWSGRAQDAGPDALAALRASALDHAAIIHHRVTIRLGQMIVLEPKNPGTRERALESRGPADLNELAFAIVTEATAGS